MLFDKISVDQINSRDGQGGLLEVRRDGASTRQQRDERQTQQWGVEALHVRPYN
jgi:hypothetical protein